MLVLILGIIFIICGIVTFYEGNRIKVKKDKQYDNYKRQLTQ